MSRTNCSLSRGEIMSDLPRPYSMRSRSSESAGLDSGLEVGVMLVISTAGMLHLNGPLRTTNWPFPSM
ncbi:hypothetical protein D9M70_647790 [compost metagenome]